LSLTVEDGLKGLRKDLAKLSQAVRSGRVRRKEVIYTRLGRLAERWPSAWSYLKEVTLAENGLVWRWDRKKLRHAWFQEGAYLLRTNLQEHDPEKLWRQYMQLIEIEAVFRPPLERFTKLKRCIIPFLA
jgi:hypothetical protein